MNLLFLVCSIPVVTAGAAYAALQDSLYLFLKKGEGCFHAGVFLKVVRKSLKGSLAVWCGGLLSMGLLAYGSLFWFSALSGGVRYLFTGFYGLVFVLVFGTVQFWLFLLGRGQEPGLAFLKDCFLLALAKFPAVLVMAAFTFSPLLVLNLTGSVLLRIFPVCLLYCFSFPAFFCVRLHDRLLPPLYPALFPDE